MLDLAQRLPDSYREPLMLRAVHGMRGKHIAAILNLSEATVETRIARARRMLRELSGDGDKKDMSNSPHRMVMARYREHDHEGAA